MPDLNYKIIYILCAIMLIIINVLNVCQEEGNDKVCKAAFSHVS
jgi:hypothetical protein